MSVIVDDAGIPAPLSSPIDASGTLVSSAPEENTGSSRAESGCAAAGPSSPPMATVYLPPQSGGASGGSRAPSSGSLCSCVVFHKTCAV